jgi:CBS-domain-containing membrane protein
MTPETPSSQRSSQFPEDLAAALARLVEAMERRDQREERLVRALELIVQVEQRKLSAAENARLKALSKSGPTTPEDIAQVRRVMARHRAKHGG